MRGRNVSAGKAEDKQHDKGEVVEENRRKRKPGGGEKGKGGKKKRDQTRGGVLKMKSFGAHGRLHRKRNNLNIYIIEIHSESIFYSLFSSDSSLLSIPLEIVCSERS
jgi:hypothetical protein